MIHLSFLQVVLVLVDTTLEAIWPLTLMITLQDNEYPYDAYVMQSLAIFVSFLVSYVIDFVRMDYEIPSFNVGWQRLFHKVIASNFVVCGVYLILVGFKTASSGAAATSGFLALPMYILIESAHGVIWWDREELEQVHDKLINTVGSAEVLLVITTCATLFILEDDASQFEGVVLLVLGRLFICIKSYINGRCGEAPPGQGTISNATLFLGINSFTMYIFSQPAAHIMQGHAQWENLIPSNWNWYTLIPFFTLACIYISNTLVEMTISGEMQSITGISGRILGMYISFTYDVTPNGTLVLSVLCITWAVIAYMRLHYNFGKSLHQSKLTSIDLNDGRKSLLGTRAPSNPQFRSLTLGKYEGFESLQAGIPGLPWIGTF